MPSNTPDDGARLVLSASEASVLAALLRLNITDDLEPRNDPALEPVIGRRRALLERLEDAIRG